MKKMTKPKYLEPQILKPSHFPIFHQKKIRKENRENSIQLSEFFPLLETVHDEQTSCVAEQKRWWLV